MPGADHESDPAEDATRAVTALDRGVYRTAGLALPAERATLAARARPVGRRTWYAMTIVGSGAILATVPAIFALLRAVGVTRGWLTLLVMVPMGLALAATRYREDRARRTVNALVTATLRDSTPAAIHGLAAACARGVGDPQLQAQAMVRLATLYLERGALDEARVLYDAALASGWISEPPPEAAICAALCDDLERVRVLRAQLVATYDDHDAATLIVDSIALLRASRYAEAFERLAACWPVAEQNLSGQWMQRLRALRAYAAAHLPEHDARRAEVDRLLAGTWPHRPAAFACLAVRWDAMRAFLASHGVPTVALERDEATLALPAARGG